MIQIQNNIKAIHSEIKKRAKKPVFIIAVTKHRTVNEILEVIKAGATDIGENRVREARDKFPFLPDTVRKHFIGRIQSNKIREIVRLFDMIQSADNLKILHKIDTEARAINKVMPVLIQVNTSNEPQKGGVKPAEAEKIIRQASDLRNIRVEGLMTMAARSDDKKKAGKYFRRLKTLSDKLQKKSLFHVQKPYLSMGMSGDYMIAIEEGANMVRIGRGLFSI